MERNQPRRWNTRRKRDQRHARLRASNTAMTRNQMGSSCSRLRPGREHMHELRPDRVQSYSRRRSAPPRGQLSCAVRLRFFGDGRVPHPGLRQRGAGPRGLCGGLTGLGFPDVLVGTFHATPPRENQAVDGPKARMAAHHPSVLLATPWPISWVQMRADRGRLGFRLRLRRWTGCERHRN